MNRQVPREGRRWLVRDEASAWGAYRPGNHGSVIPKSLGIPLRLHRAATHATVRPLTSQLFQAFDVDAIAAGQKYELLRRKLVSFFQWRGAASPEDLADETIARVGGRLDHCYRIAKLVLMRWQKGAEDQRAALSGAASMPLVDQDGDAGIRRCLERCLQYSEVSQRNLILSYYQGERLMKIYSRKRLALEMGISTEALRIRAHRIRARLEESVRASIRRQGHSKNAMEDMT